MCLHSDACLGGFVLPFARKLGYHIPPFDFGVPGYGSLLQSFVTLCPWSPHIVGLAGRGPSMQRLIGLACGIAESQGAQPVRYLHCRLLMHLLPRKPLPKPSW